MQAVQSRSQGTAQGGGSAARSALSQAQQRALIPQSTLDYPTQRLYASAIFGVLQALKAYETYRAYTATYPEQYNGAAAKWWLFDLAYLIALWILQIPWLQFSFLKTILLAFLMGIVDLLLFAIPVASLSTLLMKAFFGDMLGQQLGVSRGKMVNVKDIVFNSSHILGRHTVHILPYGTAKLNPDNGYYCIPANEIGQKDIYIPIILNNTVPRTITVSRQDFESNTRSLSDYSGRQIQRATEVGHATQGLEYYYIRVRHPGAYKLENIVSRDGLDVRLYSRNAYVFVCPNARFSPVDLQNYCSGDKEALQLDVVGVPPLHVEYTRRINGQTKALKLDRIQPEKMDSPLSRISGGFSAAEQAFFTPAYHQSYDWAASQYMSIKLNLTFEKPGEYEYELQSVTDGAGNKIDLSQLPKHTFAVHEHPTAQMQCSTTRPVKLLIGDDSVKLPVKLQGNGPWKVQYEYNSLDENDGEKKLRRLELPSADSASLVATAPGEYKLLSVTDNFCKGDILYPSTCHVVQPPLPAVQVQAFSIPSECAADSEIGMKFIAEFQGTQPFALEYRVIKQNGRKRAVVDKRREKVDRSRHMFSYLPSTSGDYIYEFTALDDGNYRNRDPQIQAVSQTVHPQPNARFVDRLRSAQSLRTCLGEPMSLDVELSGSGPFELMWTFDQQLYSDTIEGDRYTIQVPPLETPGQHVVSLIKIQDANGCAKDLEARDIVIDVRRDRPTAFFYTEDKQDALVYVAEGETAKLPLRLTGEGPWKLAYRNVDKDSKPRTLTVRDPNAEIQVREVGEYELLSVEDAVCEGDVRPPHITLQWVEKPKLSISEESAALRPNGVYERRAVCEGTDDAIDVLFSGHGPYHASYDEYRAANGKYNYALVQSDELSSGMSKNRIALLTRQSGNYRYVFNKISDQRYQRPITIAPPVTLEQSVFPNPTVKFSSRSRWDRTVCVGDEFTSDDVGAIWLELDGQAPFTVQVGLKHQSEVYGRIITLENIETRKYKLQFEDEQVTLPGRYELQLLRVQDANGCSSAVQDEKPLVIEALDIATIVPTETCQEHCVGDTLEYSLSGIAPFTIVYQFNGRNEKVHVPSSKLSMIADKPGNLTIISVGDQRNKCRSFPKGLTKIIHPIPTSLVSGGKEIIESIREGEMVQAVVDLQGTPPFDFEWQRSEAIWDHSQKRYFKGNVLETHTVHNLEDHRYYINTSKEGVIEVVSIKDRYCHYSLPHL